MTFDSLNLVAVTIECSPVPQPAIKILGSFTSLILSSNKFRLISDTTFDMDTGLDLNLKLTHLGYGLTSYWSLTFEDTLLVILSSKGKNFPNLTGLSFFILEQNSYFYVSFINLSELSSNLISVEVLD